jgi:PAS domain S-box-containing protein
VLDITVNGIRLLLKCDRVVVYQFQPSRDGVIVAESVATKSLSVINEKVVDTCFQNEIAKDYLCGKIRAIDDVYNAGLTSCHLQLLEQFSIKANLIVPILIRGREEFVTPYLQGIICNENVPNECLWGFLIAQQCDAPRHWQSEELELLDQLSGQITISIQQSLIYAQIQAELLEKQRAEAALQEAFEFVHELNLDLEAKVGERTQELQCKIAAIEASIDGIAIINEQGEYIYINAAHLNIFGYQEAKELAGKTWKIFYDLEEIRYLEQEAFSIITVEKKWQGEVLAKRRDGSKFIEELSLTMVENVGLICICRDITERVKLDDAVRQSLAREQEINQLRSDLIATASHEFRTPLTVIASSAEMLELYSDRLSSDKKKNHLQRIQSSVNHMVNLLDDVLMFNKQEENKLEFNPQTIDLVAFCENIIEELQLNTENHQIVFTVLQIGITQQVVTTVNIQCDPKLIRQILTNLLTNAIKYSPEGGNIYLNLRVEGSNLVLQIQDHGIGIPLKDQSKIFDSFYRAKNVDAISGTGLGLAIVKKCIDLHQGTINLDSQEGKGTVFTVTLPYFTGLDWYI